MNTDTLQIATLDGGRSVPDTEQLGGVASLIGGALRRVERAPPSSGSR
jgi:hypothetical protein